MDDLGLDQIDAFDFVEEVKRTSLAYYEGRASDRRELATQTSSASEKARLLRLASDDQSKAERIKTMFEEEGIILDEYDPKETEAIVNSLTRHVEQPGQKKKEDDTDKSDDEKMAAHLLKLAGQG